MSPAKSLPPRPVPDEGTGSLRRLEVLAFGWELAPILSGGLGVACAGLVRALADEGTGLTFVLPKLPVPIRGDGFRVVDARDAVDARPDSKKEDAATNIASLPVSTFEFETPLAPYQTGRSYREARAFASAGRHGHGEPARGAAESRTVSNGDGSLYGNDLASEVERLAEAAARIAAETPHDVIHCHDWMTFAAGIAARRVSGKPLVVHVHSTEGDRSGGSFGNAMIRAHEAAGLVAADRVVAVSDFTRRKILEQYPSVEAAKLRVVHNGIEPNGTHVEEPPLARVRPVVLFLGRLTAQKGPEWFLAAAELVHRLRPDTLFVVAGTGEMMPWMVERVAELGLAAHFLFTGFLSGDDIARAYSMADVFVMPSVSEPFGLVPVEAMLRGTPAIVSRQSGVSEVIRHCLKVDFWETADLADKIIGVIDHAPLATSLAAAGKREALGMGWQGPARRLLEIFAEVTSPTMQPTGASS